MARKSVSVTNPAVSTADVLAQLLASNAALITALKDVTTRLDALETVKKSPAMVAMDANLGIPTKPVEIVEKPAKKALTQAQALDRCLKEFNDTHKITDPNWAVIVHVVKIWKYYKATFDYSKPTQATWQAIMAHAETLPEVK